MNSISISSIRDHVIPGRYQKLCFDIALRTRNALRYSQASSYSRAQTPMHPITRILGNVQRGFYEAGLGLTHTSLEFFSKEKLPR